MPSQPTQERQQTQEQGSDSGDDGFDEDPGADPKGKRKGQGTQAARRDQNRIAQREFRLRKQQRIRDLELRVELLSASKDEAFLALDGMMQDLVRENSALRQLVRDLSSFIGEGIGGFLPKLGWDIASFDEFRNRSETDTMNESYQHRKKNPQVPAPGIVPVLAGQKRRVEEGPSSGTSNANASGSSRKKTKPNATESEPSSSTAGPSTSYSQGNAYSNANPSATTHASSSYTRDTLPPLSTVPAPAGGANYTNSNARSGLPPINTSNQSVGGIYASGSGGPAHNQYPLRPVALSDTSTPSLVQSTSATDEAQAAKHEEVGKLIHYHLTNYKRNPSYTLPLSLRPTQVQRTVAHEFIIDGILFPELRNRMILNKGTYDLADAAHTFFTTSIIHTDDLLTHNNWEMSEEWLNKFGFLATRSLLDTTNKWRRERGEAEIPPSILQDENASFDP